jgi:hypothetical protein
MKILKKVDYDTFLENTDFIDYIINSSSIENKEKILNTLNRITKVIKHNSEKTLKNNGVVTEDYNSDFDNLSSQDLYSKLLNLGYNIKDI